MIRSITAVAPDLGGVPGQSVTIDGSIEVVPGSFVKVIRETLGSNERRWIAGPLMLNPGQTLKVLSLSASVWMTASGSLLLGEPA